MLDVGDGVLISSAFGNVGPLAQCPIPPGAIGEERDFRRQIAEASDVIEIEVLKLIGTDNILCSLARLLAVGIAGNQFRAELGSEDRTQDRAGFLAQLVCVSHPADEELNERLRNARVNAVMGHVIPNPVGAPTESELAQVTCSQHQSL